MDRHQFIRQQIIGNEIEKLNQQQSQKSQHHRKNNETLNSTVHELCKGAYTNHGDSHGGVVLVKCLPY